MRGFFVLLAPIGLLICAHTASAQTSSKVDVLHALKRPGVHAIMRHTSAPGTGDPAGFRLDDCATQRTLNAKGRDQARSIGRALKAADIGFDHVLTSAWCRCRETADLVDVGPVETLAAINSFFRDFSVQHTQTRAVEAYVKALPQAQRVLMVTHQVNITALTGLYPRSGEVIVFDMGSDGALQVLGRIELAALR